MSEFPVTVVSTMMQHHGGTKFYHAIYLISDDEKAAAYIFRYGKVGTPGQVMSGTSNGKTVAQAEKEFHKKIDSKSGSSGYRVTDSKSHTVLSASDFSRILGPVAAPVVIRKAEDALNFLMPSEFSLGGGVKSKSKNNLEMEQTISEQKAAAERREIARLEMAAKIKAEAEAAEVKKQENMQKNNPNWGAF